MAKKFKITPEELALFQRAIKGTTPLKSKQRHAVRIGKQSQMPSPIKTISEDFTFSEVNDLRAVQSEEFIAYKQTSVSARILRKLRRSQYNVDAMLDLHGMTAAKASQAVSLFLRQCIAEELQVVLIIHGKGRGQQMPVLKNKLNHWLREIANVLAFCSATPSHGHRGALYVLLKKEKSS